MTRRVGFLAALACATAVLFAGSGTASAATTLGETFVPANDFGPTQHLIGLQAQSPGNSYTAPSAGVITSWSFQASFGAVPQGLKLKVGHPAGGAAFTIVGESPPKDPVSNQLNTFTDVSIPVQAGDVIGLWPGTTVPNAHFFRTVGGSGGGFEGVTHNGDLAPGETDDFSAPAGEQFDVSAKLEPDADHDGFGDETQDQCPTGAATQGACPNSAPAKKKCKKHKKHKRSAQSAKKKKCGKKKKHEH
jgi:hypothetical protein